MSVTYPIGADGLIILRVSDEVQSGDNAQLLNLRALGKTLSVNVIDEIRDEGESGDDLTRPGIAAIESHVERGRRRGRSVVWLLVDKSDRLSRADSLDTNELLARLRRGGVRFIATPSRVFDLWNNLDRTLLGIECDHKNNPQLKEIARTCLDGMVDVARKLCWTGGPVPLGYRLGDAAPDHGRAANGRKKRRRSRPLEKDEKTAAIVTEAFRVYVDGGSVRDVQRYVTAATGRHWTHRGISRLLRNRIYTGTMEWGKRGHGRHASLKDGHAAVHDAGCDHADAGAVLISGYPRLVDDDTFMRVQERLSEGGQLSRRKDARPSALSGLLRCGHCGKKMSGTADRYNGRYYRCQNEQCRPNLHVKIEEADRRVLALLAERLLNGDTMANLVALAGRAEGEARQVWEKQVAATKQAMESNSQRIEKARRRLLDADDDMRAEYEGALRELRAEQEQLAARLREAAASEPLPGEGESVRLERWLKACQSACQAGAEDDPAQLSQWLRLLLDKVTVYRPAQRRVRGVTVGVVELTLPEWLSRHVSVLGTTAGRCTHDAVRIVLSSPDPTANPA